MQRICKYNVSVTFELFLPTQAFRDVLVSLALAPPPSLIPKFLSDYETDEIIKLARPQIHNSLVGDNDGGGARASDTRTSRNAWVGRKSSKVTETLYVRAAHLLKLDEKLLNSFTNAEDMQVVHYVNGQKYDSHHDWGVSGHPELGSY